MDYNFSTYVIIPTNFLVEDNSSTKTSGRVNTSSSNWYSCQMHQEHSESNWQRCQNLLMEN